MSLSLEHISEELIKIVGLAAGGLWAACIPML
jgi:hypothetical protein